MKLESLRNEVASLMLEPKEAPPTNSSAMFAANVVFEKSCQLLFPLDDELGSFRSCSAARPTGRGGVVLASSAIS